MSRSAQHRVRSPTATSPHDGAALQWRFTGQLHIADIGYRENARPVRVVTRPFAFGLTGQDDPNRIVVPAGFCSDGASVPLFFRGMMDSWGRFAQAAIVHDLIYSTHVLSRATADRILHDAIEATDGVAGPDGAPGNARRTADLAYWGVRVGGWYAYRFGKSRYTRRARRAQLSAEKTDPDLARTIITDWHDLAGAQPVGDRMPGATKWRRWAFRRRA